MFIHCNMIWYFLNYDELFWKFGRFIYFSTRKYMIWYRMTFFAILCSINSLISFFLAFNPFLQFTIDRRSALDILNLDVDYRRNRSVINESDMYAYLIDASKNE